MASTNMARAASEHRDESLRHFTGKAATWMETKANSGRSLASASLRRCAALLKPGLLRRIVRAMVESRQRQTDREIARFLARSGGRLTDDMERRLTQYLLSRNCTIRD
jgi:hypothetical protein